MTKKDYILIAEELRIMYHLAKHRSEEALAADMIMTLAGNLSVQFYKENNRFDKHKFLSLIEKPY